MEGIFIPVFEEIASMSRERCQNERIRLKNEISFARGNALWGGPSQDLSVAALKEAVNSIERRLCELAVAEDTNLEDINWMSTRKLISEPAF